MDVKVTVKRDELHNKIDATFEDLLKKTEVDLENGVSISIDRRRKKERQVTIYFAYDGNRPHHYCCLDDLREWLWEFFFNDFLDYEFLED